MNDDLDFLLGLAVKAAQAGAAEVRTRFGNHGGETGKGHLDFATEADLRSEQAVREVLAASGLPVTGEEYGSSGETGSNLRWYVDPLCGTVNFARGIRFFSVNVGLCRAGVPALGVSIDPMTGELFTGMVGEGAVVLDAEGQPTRLDTTANASPLVEVDFQHATPGVAAYQTYRLPLLPAFAERYIPLRLGSSLAVSYVAAGRLGGFLHDGPDMDVHFAAHVAIVRAAGGVVVDAAGESWRVGATGLLAAPTIEAATHLLGLWRQSGSNPAGGEQ